MKSPLAKNVTEPICSATSSGVLHLEALLHVPKKSTATLIIRNTIRIKFHLQKITKRLLASNCGSKIMEKSKSHGYLNFFFDSGTSPIIFPKVIKGFKATFRSFLSGFILSSEDTILHANPITMRLIPWTKLIFVRTTAKKTQMQLTSYATSMDYKGYRIPGAREIKYLERYVEDKVHRRAKFIREFTRLLDSNLI